jgi:IS30 family transposase
MSDNKHLTLDERRIIEKGINSGATKTSIADTIGKDNSTIGKEIKQHRKITYKCHFPLECVNYKHCKNGRACTAECEGYEPFKCTRRDRSPGACNGCAGYNSCRFTKYRYDAMAADHDYRTELKESREGINLTAAEAKSMSDIIAPLLRQGQSPYQILVTHPELGICEKTLYNYIDEGVFSVVGGIGNLDLRRKVGRKMSKKKTVAYKKREDRKYLNGRTYRDYKEFMNCNPNALVTEMDTVYNDVSDGPFIQTFSFKGTRFLMALLHDSRTAEEMKNGVDLLDDTILGHALFEKHVSVLLTDRGSEFTAADAIEVRPDETRRTRLYFCDPMQSGQKGALENKHEMLRYICPKETNLRGIGLVSQEALNLALSHINSAPLESLNGKSPLDFIEFLYPDLFEKLETFGIVKIPKDEILLKPRLLKRFVK